MLQSNLPDFSNYFFNFHVKYKKLFKSAIYDSQRLYHFSIVKSINKLFNFQRYREKNQELENKKAQILGNVRNIYGFKLGVP